MNRLALDVLRMLLLGTLILLSVVVTRSTILLRDRTLSALDEVHAIEVNTTRSEAELTGLLNVTRQVAIKERQASDEQIKQIDALSKQTGGLIEQARFTLGDLDAAAKQALGGAATDEQRLAALLDQSTDSIRDVTAHTDVVLSNAAETLDVIDTRAAMANIVTATENIQTTSAEAASAMATVRKGVEAEVAQLTAPPRKIKWLSEEAVRMIGKFLGY